MMKRKYVIPPEPVKFGIMLVGTIMSGIMMLAGVEFDYPVVDPWLLFVVGIWCTIVTGKYYVIDTNSITEKFLFIPIQRARWESIKQILLFEKSNDDKRSKGNALFILTCHGCDALNPETESVSAYLKRYREFVIKIEVPPKKKHQHKAMLEKIYGPVLEFD